jgi:TrmH family RNA methyltransferase
VSDELITSSSNPLVRRARKLRHRKFREAEGVFLIEGIAQVRQAIDHGVPLESILVAPELLASDGALQAVEQQATAGTRVARLGREAFESIVERDHPSGLAAIAPLRRAPVTDLVAAPDSLFVAAHEVGNPGNLGSIIRTVDAVGGSGVIVVGKSTDHHHPASVKASMGTMFSVPVVYARDFDEVFAWCLMEEVSTVATSSKVATSFYDAELDTPLLVILGSETTGLPRDVLERAEGAVTIPMQGAASSLNLAVSCGVLLYEIKRRV